MRLKHDLRVPSGEMCGHEVLKLQKMFKMHAFDVFECFEVFALLICIVYALVLVIYFCRHNLQKCRSDKI